MPNLPQIIFLAICIGISAYAGRHFVNAVRSRSWPSVEGMITTSRIETVPSESRGGFHTFLVFEYSYTVDGRLYTGKRIAMAPKGWFSLGTPESLQGKYPKGAHVTVFYSPTKPGMATLVRGLPSGQWSFYAIAGMFALLGAVLIVNLF